MADTVHSVLYITMYIDVIGMGSIEIPSPADM
jgi:hypothetical protein